MATEAQLIANRRNAQNSTGPRTPEGRGRASQNALRFGLFSTKNCVRAEETEEYATLAAALWTDLSPSGTLQELFAVEVVRATWRLRRCAEVESALAENTPDADPMLHPEHSRIQSAVDRARAQAHGILRRSLADLRRLQAGQPANPRPAITAPAKPTQSDFPAAAITPRNAACPCGSNQKFKRCCGRNAPALLHHAA